jgi:hypothetical protein
MCEFFSERMCELTNLETYREKALKCMRAAGEAHDAGELPSYSASPAFTRRLPITTIVCISTAATRIKMRKVAAECYCSVRVQLPSLPTWTAGRHCISPCSAHLSFITGNGQRASVAESGSCSRPHKVRERHMPQSHFSHGQETIRAAAESRQGCADFIRRGRAEFAETRAATLKAIAESREFMTKIDADIRKP